METLLAGLLGALIGAGASIATVWLQTNLQAKRERLKLASELAQADYNASLNLVKSSGRSFSMPPVSVYLHYHLALIALMERGNVKPADIEKLMAENREILSAIERFQKSREEIP
jgi:hypothetical protein